MGARKVTQCWETFLQCMTYQLYMLRCFFSLARLLARVLQNVLIRLLDCKTNKGEVHLQSATCTVLSGIMRLHRRGQYGFLKYLSLH
jgi:hypothetical protein